MNFESRWKFIANNAKSAVVSAVLDGVLRQSQCLVYVNGIEYTNPNYCHNQEILNEAMKQGYLQAKRKIPTEIERLAPDRRVWSSNKGEHLYEYKVVSYKTTWRELLRHIDRYKDYFASQGVVFVVLKKESFSDQCHDYLLWAGYFDRSKSITWVSFEDYCKDSGIPLDTQLLRAGLEYLKPTLNEMDWRAAMIRAHFNEEKEHP